MHVLVRRLAQLYCIDCDCDKSLLLSVFNTRIEKKAVQTGACCLDTLFWNAFCRTSTKICKSWNYGSSRIRPSHQVKGGEDKAARKLATMMNKQEEIPGESLYSAQRKISVNGGSLHGNSQPQSVPISET